ncbi:IS30 family transposase [Marinobacter persicus]|jgi:IS30 family transposase|uniref:IS30 family transposase n=1 Tax=Marinobacter persicus TaxID=930118 RepID=A0A2S6G1Q2_9GAMM|nr:IS30 family transposase [Marinobacter persicus]KXS47367.1 MAG: integrase catalytic subunit [Marinobacter sp. T13-3]PPK47942.1 IS30 family transposase [Marinobacter persicus]PPK49896.1 IS30 family transposase [Marinobacter persicus]PPK54012.1 IS30 family transposase [Marinobacter persicus]|tara:strand:+ start:55 stop:1074 length:1020 start_codon:yes stop_codon:yes gene_type:complete
MNNHYRHLSTTDRVTLMLMMRQGASLRAVARELKRSPSTLSRELRRHAVDGQPYDAQAAALSSRSARLACRPKPKLAEGTDLHNIVLDMLRNRWSPQQISGTLKAMFPDQPHYQVSHETVYKSIYAQPHGELRKELIACLRQGKTKRRPRAGGVDRRQQIPDLVSIHLRPPEVDERLLPGHWEGDLIKGAFNRSAVGTLVERVSGLVFLAKMDGATATAAVQGFSAALNRVPLEMRQTFTYDQGRELVRHAEITQKTGTAIYFADPHSPWQRAINENTNGLLRQYMPKGTDLSVFSQDDLDAIAFQLNTRPRKRLGFKPPLEVFMDLIKRTQDAPPGVH